MPREIRLEQQDELKYILNPVLNAKERTDGAYPVEVSGSSKSVDGHFLVRLHQSLDDSSIDSVVGVAHKPEELPKKVYECAREAGRKYAEKLECRFVDTTFEAQESGLPKVWDYSAPGKVRISNRN